MKRLFVILAALLFLCGMVRAQSLQDVVESRRDCATCHLEWSADFANPNAVLLMDKPNISMASRESTCLGCHDGAILDSRKKVWQEQSHRTGVVPPATMHVPTTLPLEQGKLACRTCHTAHNFPSGPGFANTFFLRLDNDQSQLCRACHGEKAAGPMMGSHPIGKMPIPVPATLIAAGAKTGPPAHELVCQSCHEAHGSKAEKLLVISAGNSALCTSCHDKMRPGMFEIDSLYGHPFNRPLETETQRQAILDMGTHFGPNNTLVCLSCHRMHDSKTPGNLLADTMVDGKLCLRCHADRAIVAGTKHDMRKMAPTTRNVLGQTAAQAGPCGACHEPHQPARTPVVSPGDPKGLCSSCHAEGRLAAKAGPARDHHPESVLRSDLPANLTLSISPDRHDPNRAEVTCKTCHDPHDPTRTFFLRDKPQDLCARCHQDQVTQLAGAHDFITHPAARNGLGKSAAETGKCGFCHDVHRATGAALWVATADTPSTAAELCIDCHRTGGLATELPAPKFSHPTGARYPAIRPAAVPLPLFDAAGHRVAGNGLVECASCHNPHANAKKSPLLLRVTGRTSDLCLRCHAEKATLVGSIHDSRTHQTWPGSGASSGADLCIACHRAHGTTSLWAVTPVTGQPQADGVCIACHGDHAWAAADDDTPAKGAMMHPQKLANAASCPLPLVAPVGSEARTQIGCKTCHDPHASRSAVALLRSPSPTQPESLCFTCHQNATGLDRSMHAGPILANAHLMPATGKLPCAPCHGVHAGDNTHRDKLWAGKLDTLAATGNEQRCLGCHDNSSAPRPDIPVHPQVIFDLAIWKNLPGTPPPQFMPTDRSIPCNVCHLPHGPLPADSPNIPANLRGPYKVMLRPGVAKSICSTCHGTDADRVMLYYHHPQQRQDVQVLEQPPEAAQGN